VIYYDPSTNRFRNTDTGYFVKESIGDSFGIDEEELEDTFFFITWLEKPKSGKKKKKKKKRTKRKLDKESAVDKRLNDIMDDWKEIMDEVVAS